MYDDKAIYLEGYDAIKKIERDSICVIYKRNVYEISGDKLEIEYLNGSEIMIKGIIVNTTWQHPNGL